MSVSGKHLSGIGARATVYAASCIHWCALRERGRHVRRVVHARKNASIEGAFLRTGRMEVDIKEVKLIGADDCKDKISWWPPVPAEPAQRDEQEAESLGPVRWRKLIPACPAHGQRNLVGPGVKINTGHVTHVYHGILVQASPCPCNGEFLRLVGRASDARSR